MSKFNKTISKYLIDSDMDYIKNLAMTAIIKYVEEILGDNIKVRYSKHIDQDVIEWEYPSNIGCQVMISNSGQVFASAANLNVEYIPDGDNELFECHSVFIKNFNDFFGEAFTDLIKTMKNLNS